MNTKADYKAMLLMMMIIILDGEVIDRPTV